MRVLVSLIVVLAVLSVVVNGFIGERPRNRWYDTYCMEWPDEPDCY